MSGDQKAIIDALIGHRDLLIAQLAEAIAAKEAIEKQFAECYAQDQIADHNTLECEL